MIQSVLSLFQVSQTGMIFPNHFIGWLGWFVMAACLVWGILRRWEGLDLLRERWWLAIVLLVLTPICTGFFGLRLPGEVQPMPEVPLDMMPPALMLLAALPWVFAAGLLGPLPAVVLGVLSGLILGYFETRSPFTPLEIGGLALLFSAAVRQNYRTAFYRLLSNPLAAALVVIVAYIPILILTTLLATNETLAVRLDYAFTQVWLVLAARAGELLIASIAAQILFLARPDLWGNQRPLVPSPSESSIQARFFFGTVPLVALLVLTLIIGDWLVAGNAARRMLRDQLSQTAKVAAESVPYFLETGQNLIVTLSTADLMELPEEEVPDALAKRLRSVPYFNQLFLFGAGGEGLSGYPVEDSNQYSLTDEEKNGVQLALKGVSTQVYVVPPLLNETASQISFLAAVRDVNEEVVGVLLGRTNLEVNPFIQPAIQALSNREGTGADWEGMILNEKGIILYHSASSRVMEPYQGSLPAEADFFDETSSTNTRQYVYYQPVNGRSWSIVVTVPAREAQQIALDIAIPLLVMVLVFSVLAFVFLRLSLRAMTSSLKALSLESTHISQGHFDRPLKVKGVDEVGQLGSAFEQMRQSLKARLEELNSLLNVSQGVAANLDIAEAVTPILTAALLETPALRGWCWCAM